MKKQKSNLQLEKSLSPYIFVYGNLYGVRRKQEQNKKTAKPRRRLTLYNSIVFSLDFCLFALERNDKDYNKHLL